MGLALSPVARAEGRPLLLHNPKSDVPAGKALVVDGTLVDADQIDKLTLRYRTGSGDWHTVPMELQYGDLYRGVIPANQVSAPSLEYFVSASTYSGDRFDVFRSADRPARVDVEGAVPVTAEATPASEPAPAPRPERKNSRNRRHEPEPTPVVVSPPPERKPEPTPAPPPPVPAPKPLRPAIADSDSSSVLLHRSALDDDLAAFSAGLPTQLPAEVAVPVGTPEDNGVLVYEQRQIQALGARSVFDVLDVVPGLTVSRDVQGFYRVSVRGVRSDPEVLFLIDGHPLNDVYDGRALSNLPVDNLSRIEVIRGPGAATWGHGAFLAVVNLVSDHGEGVRGTAAGGSYGAFDGHLSASHQLGGLRLFIDGDGSRQDGERIAITKDVLDGQTQALGRDPQSPAGYTNDRRTLANIGAGLSVGGFSASARFLREDRGALLGLFDSVGSDSDLSWQVILADLDYTHPVTDRFSFRLHGYGDLQTIDRLFQLSPKGFNTNVAGDSTHFFPDGLLEQVQAKTSRVGAEASAQVQLATQNALSFGLSAEQQRLASYSLDTNFTSNGTFQPMEKPAGLLYPGETDPAAVKRLWLALFVDDSWQLGQRFSLDVGFRLEAVQLPDAQAVPGATQLSPRFNPRAALSFVPVDGLRLSVSYARAFRPPTVQELAEQTPNTFYTQGQYTGNDALVPPTVDVVQLGGQLVQPIDAARIRISGTVFYERFTQPIAAVDLSGNIVPRSNREGMRSFGAEGEARVELSRRASAWVNATWFRAEDLESPSGFGLLTDTPQIRFNAGLTLPLGPWFDVDVYSEFGAERRNDTRSVLEQIRRYSIPSYSVATAQVRTERLWDHFEFALIGHNVFDVQRVDDVPRPDRIPGQLPRDGIEGTLLMRAIY